MHAQIHPNYYHRKFGFTCIQLMLTILATKCRVWQDPYRLVLWRMNSNLQTSSFWFSFITCRNWKKYWQISHLLGAWIWRNRNLRIPLLMSWRWACMHDFTLTIPLHTCASTRSLYTCLQYSVIMTYFLWRHTCFKIRVKYVLQGKLVFLQTANCSQIAVCFLCNY